MKQLRLNLKPTQVFDWHTEPVDERPSEFVQSTGYSALSGYCAMPDTPVEPRRPRPRAGRGARLALLIGSLIIALGAAALLFVVQLLRG